MYLTPDRAHPHPPLPAEDLADRLCVGTSEVLAWMREGLPQVQGLIDPFAAANWLSWGRLDRCPILKRRWRSYLRLFDAHAHGVEKAQSYQVQQQQRLFLPHPVEELTWYVPRLASSTAQSASSRGEPTSEASHVQSTGPFWQLHWTAATGTTPSLRAAWQVVVQPQPVDLFPDRAQLVQLVEGLVADFRYEYRHHAPTEDRTPPAGSPPVHHGSCLDCALELGRRLDELGRPWRLCTGVIASSALSNPHFWLRVDTTRGWVTVDPTLPAIARMLEADWRSLVEAYVGGCDARRIIIAEVDTPLPGVPGGPSLGSRVGEAVVVHQGGRLNAWPCLDWVCGECDWTFA